MTGETSFHKRKSHGVPSDAIMIITNTKFTVNFTEMLVSTFPIFTASLVV